MNLRELLDSEPAVLQEQLIGKELEILGKKALLLGIQEVEWQGSEGPERAARLYLLYEQPPADDASWKAEWEMDLEDSWEMTNRQYLLEKLDAEEQRPVTDIRGFRVRGTLYETIVPKFAGASQGFVGLEGRTYEEVRIARHFAEKQVIPDTWMDKELEQLAVAGYYAKTDILNVDWNGDSPGIFVEMKEPNETFPVGKVLELSCGQYEPPKELSIKGKNGEDIPVKIHGLHLHDVWDEEEEWVNREYSDWDEEDMEELEEQCGLDERLLAVEYSAPEGIQLYFYEKEYLDSPAGGTGDPAAWELLFGTEDYEELAVAAVVPEDFSRSVKLELLSYVKFGS